MCACGVYAGIEYHQIPFLLRQIRHAKIMTHRIGHYLIVSCFRIDVMMRLLPVLLLLAIPAYASSCIEISVCAAYSSKDIPLIFRGEAVEVTTEPLPPPPAGLALLRRATDNVRFLVREVLKGKLPSQEITIQVPTGAYQVGHEYLVYVGANGPTNALFANSCVHQQDLSKADGEASDLQLLRDLSSADSKGVIFGRLYLRGSTTGGDAAPVEDAEVMVSIQGPVSREAQAERGSGEQVYLLAGVPPGDYVVAAKAAPGVAVIPVDKAGGPISVAANSCREVDWFLRVDSHIRGRVTDAAGRPVARANVGLFARGKDEAGLARGRVASFAYMVTDVDGRYEFAGVNPGDYSVVLHPSPAKEEDPYPPVFYPAQTLPSDATVLHLKGAETLEGIDLVRPAPLRVATVHLAVKRADGTPIENAMVIVTDPASAVQTAATGRTDSNGLLEVQLFAEREYTITASTPDPTGQVQESPQCAGPVEFVAEDEMDLAPLVPDKTFHACRSAARPGLLGHN
jgi:Carboxypeptidase regulatory-like domain